MSIPTLLYRIYKNRIEGEEIAFLAIYITCYYPPTPHNNHLQHCY